VCAVAHEPNRTIEARRAHSMHRALDMRRKKNAVKEIIFTVGDTTGSFAKSVGSRTVDIAKYVGAKRALIGLAVIAAAVGGSIVLVRYLRRREEELEIEGGDMSRETRSRKVARAERRAVNTANAAMR
jgi:hypothetical protein